MAFLMVSISSRFETWSIKTEVLTSKELMAFDLYSSKVIMSTGITHHDLDKNY